uniref:Uncharacterized protein n=1 Tax=Solanum tuberosum TaxID=4113 RepID=M1AYJ6_SOLTU
MKASLGNLAFSLEPSAPKKAETAISSPDSHLLRRTTSWDCGESQSTTKSPKLLLSSFCLNQKKKAKLKKCSDFKL